jgi:hypothetical protein
MDTSQYTSFRRHPGFWRLTPFGPISVAGGMVRSGIAQFGCHGRSKNKLISLQTLSFRCTGKVVEKNLKSFPIFGSPQSPQINARLPAPLFGLPVPAKSFVLRATVGDASRVMAIRHLQVVCLRFRFRASFDASRSAFVISRAGSDPRRRASGVFGRRDRLPACEHLATWVERDSGFGDQIAAALKGAAASNRVASWAYARRKRPLRLGLLAW